MPTGLYETDFHAWALAQAAALRAAGARHLSNEIDWDHVADEIAGIGSVQALALESAFARAIEHLLRIEHASGGQRRGWREIVAIQRAEIARRLQRNPSLARRLGELFDQAWRDGRALAAMALEADDGTAPAHLPRDCPYTLEEVRSPGWWPATLHIVR